MKVLIIAPYKAPIISRLIVNLKKLGVEVEIASHNAKDIRGVHDLGALRGFKSYLNFWKVNRLVRQINPDVVHAHVSNHYGVMCILQNKPLLLALWGSDIMLSVKDGGLIKRSIYKFLNWAALLRANTCHTSGSHVAMEASRQCSAVSDRMRVFYWGFPVDNLEEKDKQVYLEMLEKEFGQLPSKLIVFPRGLSPVYNPEAYVNIIRLLNESMPSDSAIVVLRGFATQKEEAKFLELASDLNFVYVNRLLNSKELSALYSKTVMHISIPISDSLGGGVVEPALFGSIPVLSDLPSYNDYAKKYPAIILKNYKDDLEKMLHYTQSSCFSQSKNNVPVDYTAERIANNILVLYKKLLK